MYDDVPVSSRAVQLDSPAFLRHCATVSRIFGIRGLKSAIILLVKSRSQSRFGLRMAKNFVYLAEGQLMG